MSSPDIGKKSQLRKELILARQAQSAGEVAHRSRNIFVTFQKNAAELLPESYASVALYFPIKGEVDTRPFFDFFKARRKTVLFPRMSGAISLEFHDIRDWSELRTGAHGIAEPQSRPGARPVRPDVVLVPGVAFSRDGHRLGFGAGYYDRVIDAWAASGTIPRLLAPAYNFQLIDALPTDPHDRPMDFLILESKIIKKGDA